MPTTHSLTRLRLISLAALSLTVTFLLKADRPVTSASAIPGMQTLPALQGQPAVDYLKEHGLYNRLHNSIETSQYELAPLSQNHLARTSTAYQASNPAQHLQASFNGERVLLEPLRNTSRQDWRAGLQLHGVGYGARVNSVAPGQLCANGNRIEITRAALVEWYVNTQAGIEQGFTLKARPGVSFGSEPLRLTMAITGGLIVSLAEDGQTVILSQRNGRQVLRYDHLTAYDALGRILPARMEVREAELALVVDDAAAVYPVTIDPLFTQVKKLTASDSEASDVFGLAVAISGNTLVVGATGKNSSTGAVYIFERNQGGANNWGQVKKLTASDGVPGEYFGQAVGISHDTVVVGAFNNNSGMGAAYIFRRNQGGTSKGGKSQKIAGPGYGQGRPIWLFGGDRQ
jgi:hypothetical protein